ncbi:MAG: GtrA family protein [Patescibacteria group bacterium]
MRMNPPEWVRILMISFIALAGDVIVLIFLTNFAHVFYLFSAAISFAVGLVINYYLSVRWGFSKRKLNNPRRELFVFCLIGITGACINELLLWGFTGLLGGHVLYSKAASVATVFWWNYGLRKVLLFS